MAEFNDNKTEAPTPRRRETARREGQVVFSPDLTGGILLVLITLSAGFMGAAWIRAVAELVHDQVRGIQRTDWGHAQSLLTMRWLAAQTLILGGGICAGAWGINCLTSVWQSGFLVSTKPLSPDWERLSPSKGWQRLASLDGLFRSVLAPLKVGSALAVGITMVGIWREEISLAARGSLAASLDGAGGMFFASLFALSGAMLVWGVCDYTFRWFRQEHRLRMSREELKQEAKEDQGDPQLRQRMRHLQRESRAQKTLNDVPTATAVVTNPTHFAVALRYEAARHSAPVVVAKGTDRMARRIIDRARKHGVPVLERKPLARALFALADVGEQIPIEFYRAVAEVLAYVYRMKQPH